MSSVFIQEAADLAFDPEDSQFKFCIKKVPRGVSELGQPFQAVSRVTVFITA